MDGDVLREPFPFVPIDQAHVGDSAVFFAGPTPATTVLIPPPLLAHDGSSLTTIVTEKQAPSTVTWFAPIVAIAFPTGHFITAEDTLDTLDDSLDWLLADIEELVLLLLWLEDDWEDELLLDTLEELLLLDREETDDAEEGELLLWLDGLLTLDRLLRLDLLLEDDEEDWLLLLWLDGLLTLLGLLQLDQLLDE